MTQALQLFDDAWLAEATLENPAREREVIFRLLEQMTRRMEAVLARASPPGP